MSHARTREEMEAMRSRFTSGACACGETEEDATRVFDAISAFVGYGFCKSHAAEFARTIYQTAWLKAHYPAHYLAAFLSCQPAGFFPPHVVLEEAKRLGIPVLGVDINCSAERFSVERVGSPPGRWAIRIGLAQVAHVGEELAEAILWERRGRSDGGSDGGSGEEQCGGERRFASLADFCTRLRPHGLSWQAMEALALAGACDGLRPAMERRRRLWQLHELWPLVGRARASGRAQSGRGRRRRGGEQGAEQLTFEWVVGPEQMVEVPALPSLDGEERVALDYQLLGLSARPHPMRLMRRELRRSGVRAIAELAEVAEGRAVRVAGWPISAQRPPTAKGMGFLVLEDETGRLPVALPPRLAAEMHRVIRGSRAVVVSGRVERVRWYRSLLALDLQRGA
jgi:error-prone DNA polymerase